MKKKAHIYTWEDEPVDERPSEFMSSTGYPPLSDFYPMMVAQQPDRPRSRFGFSALLIVALLPVVLGGFALAKLVPLLRI